MKKLPSGKPNACPRPHRRDAAAEPLALSLDSILADRFMAAASARSDRSNGAAAVARQLAWHGIRAEGQTVKAEPDADAL
jgi:hypothetical protein